MITSYDLSRSPPSIAPVPPFTSTNSTCGAPCFSHRPSSVAIFHGRLKCSGTPPTVIFAIWTSLEG